MLQNTMYLPLNIKFKSKTIGNSALCYMAAWMGVEFGGEWIHVWTSQVRLAVKNLSANADSKKETQEGMATHSSTLAWRIPRTEEPDRLWSTGSQRVEHD